MLRKNLLDSETRLPLGSIDQKVYLLDLTSEQLKKFVVDLGDKPYRQTQLINWVFRKGETDFFNMTDISSDSLKNYMRVSTAAPKVKPLETQTDPDGTVKILWELNDGLTIESVLIDEDTHVTMCLSTQVGCRMGCRFCRTGLIGFKRQMTQGEILSQVIEGRRLINKTKSLTNLVFMGMGEPLDNHANTLSSINYLTGTNMMGFSQRRVTLSTVGVIPELEKLISQTNRLDCSLTISMGSAIDSVRSQLMPINRQFPLKDLRKVLERYTPAQRGRRITFAYVLLEGVNDSQQQALALVKFLSGLKAKVNLIPFNPWPEAPFKRPSNEAILNFQNVLLSHNLTAIIRRTNGQEVNAACGLLTGRHLKNQESSTALYPLTTAQTKSLAS
ncbi:MAG: 23S rRNA (adenine(2503)-C(2))-methyltransferase RlmN [Deltaproteobacteria bacterium]|nr:23S rRNA (adenine(2503)-C(2))-methyltransferase RlmN [Deltaproteobacteria bacterium]